MGDPEKTYRTKEEVEAKKAEEPLVRAREKLLQEGVDAAELDAMEQPIKERLAALREWAIEQPFPTLEQAIDHVYIPLTEGEKACR